MIEKPMAADLVGADALLAASRRARLPLMVNWPTAWRPALRHGLVLAGTGEVGEPVQVSHRGRHAGPRECGCSSHFCDWLYDPVRNGGGALVIRCRCRPTSATRQPTSSPAWRPAARSRLSARPRSGATCRRSSTPPYGRARQASVSCCRRPPEPRYLAPLGIRFHPGAETARIAAQRGARRLKTPQVGLVSKLPWTPHAVVAGSILGSSFPSRGQGWQ